MSAEGNGAQVSRGKGKKRFFQFQRGNFTSQLFLVLFFPSCYRLCTAHDVAPLFAVNLRNAYIKQTLWQNKQIVHPLMVRQFIQKARHVPVKASQCEHEQSQVLLLKKKEALCSIPKALRFVLASDASVFLFCKLLNPFVRFNPI